MTVSGRVASSGDPYSPSHPTARPSDPFTSSVRCPVCAPHPFLKKEETYLVCHNCGHVDSVSLASGALTSSHEFFSTSTHLGFLENHLRLDKGAGSIYATEKGGTKGRRYLPRDNDGERALSRQTRLNSIKRLIQGLCAKGKLADIPGIPPRAFHLFEEWVRFQTEIQKRQERLGEDAKWHAGACVVITALEYGLKVNPRDEEPRLRSLVTARPNANLRKTCAQIVDDLNLDKAQIRFPSIDAHEVAEQIVIDRLEKIANDPAKYAEGVELTAGQLDFVRKTLPHKQQILSLAHAIIDLTVLAGAADRSQYILACATTYLALESLNGLAPLLFSPILHAISVGVEQTSLYSVQERYRELVRLINDWLLHLPGIGKARPLQELNKTNKWGKKDRVLGARQWAVLLIPDVIEQRDAIKKAMDEGSKPAPDAFLAFVPQAAIPSGVTSHKLYMASEPKAISEAPPDQLSSSASNAESSVSASIRPRWPEPGSVPDGEGWSSTTSWPDPRLALPDVEEIGKKITKKGARPRKRSAVQADVLASTSHKGPRLPRDKSMYARIRPSLDSYAGKPKRSRMVESYVRRWVEDHHGEAPDTRSHPLKRLLLQGTKPKDIPHHLFPTSILMAQTILDNKNIDSDAEDDLFEAGEMDSYFATEKEKEATLRRWAHDGIIGSSGIEEKAKPTITRGRKSRKVNADRWVEWQKEVKSSLELERVLIDGDEDDDQKEINSIAEEISQELPLENH